MKRSALALGAAIFTAAGAPGAASASTVQIGATSSPVVAPTCPTGVSASACSIVLAQMTAVETLRDGISYPSTIHQPGEIVSFTVGVSQLSSVAATQKQYVTGLNKTWGGAPAVQVTVLRPVGSAANFRWSVAGQSLPIQLTNFLGRVVEFPLSANIPVVPGEVVALTSPTWAPVLSIDLSTTKFAYRQSRRASCTTTLTDQQELLTIGQEAMFGCSYTGTRVEYSASEVLTPGAQRDARQVADRRPADRRR